MVRREAGKIFGDRGEQNDVMGTHSFPWAAHRCPWAIEATSSEIHPSLSQSIPVHPPPHTEDPSAQSDPNKTPHSICASLKYLLLKSK